MIVPPKPYFVAVLLRFFVVVARSKCFVVVALLKAGCGFVLLKDSYMGSLRKAIQLKAPLMPYLVVAPSTVASLVR
jgi:hypothetical protein